MIGTRCGRPRASAVARRATGAAANRAPAPRPAFTTRGARRSRPPSARAPRSTGPGRRREPVHGAPHARLAARSSPRGVGGHADRPGPRSGARRARAARRCARTGRRAVVGQPARRRSASTRSSTVGPLPPTSTGGCGRCAGLGHDQMRSKSTKLAVVARLVLRSRSPSSPRCARASAPSACAGRCRGWRISSRFQPAPTPNSTRPPERWSMLATSFAVMIGSRSMTRQMPLPTRSRVVAAAAARQRDEQVVACASTCAGSSPPPG